MSSYFNLLVLLIIHSINMSGAALSGSGSGSMTDTNSSVPVTSTNNNSTKCDDIEDGDTICIKYSFNGGSWWIIFIVIGPFICTLCTGCGVVWLLDPIADAWNKLKSICKHTRKQLSPSQIKNGKLNTSFIKKLNETNKSNVNVSTQLQCSICIEDITLENYKDNSSKLVFLNCSHVFHTDCIQPWVKTQIKQITHPNCPLCRDIIIDIPTKLTYISDFDYYSDSSLDYGA